MYHVAELPKGGFATYQYRHLLNDIGSMGTIGMTAEKTVVSVDEEFQHSLRLAHGQGLTIGTPEGFTTGVGKAPLLELVFRGSDTGSFRSGEDGGRHHVEANAVLSA